ncbi:MAG: DNA translocase FtsK 4TM domain-containing protein, partial [Candidatus Saccharimonadales bacterium]
MAKRKKRSSRKQTKQVPQHTLPVGFWSQVGAVALAALSVLFIVAWFGVGGPVLEWLQTATLATIGWAVYVLPLLFIYISIEIFRSENNRVPVVLHVSAFALIMWFAGLFGLLGASDKQTGGFLGKTLNDGVLALVDSGVAIFVYLLLIFLTTLFILKVSPFVLIGKLWELMKTRSEENEQKQNVKIMKKAAALDIKGQTAAIDADFKLNAGVPLADAGDSKQRSSFRGSIQQDKAAEAKSALVSVSDPNWKAPSIDLLEKKQKPADAGDVQGNAQIIKETLGEFSIDVEMEGANIGPKVTQYTLKPPSGVKLTRIAALETNIALNLAAQSLRIEAPIPGQRAVGIEVPNIRAADVRLRGILESKQWVTSHEPLGFAIGKDISGEAVVGQLNKMPHMLIAGQTG